MARREVLDSYERLCGREIASIHECADDELRIEFADGWRADFYHDQDCCERVFIENTIGDLQSLVGKSLVSITKSYDEPDCADDDYGYGDDSHTWSTFTLRANDGTEVVVRWLGVSNGYYGEDVYVSFE